MYKYNIFNFKKENALDTNPFTFPNHFRPKQRNKLWANGWLSRSTKLSYKRGWRVSKIYDRLILWCDWAYWKRVSTISGQPCLMVGHKSFRSLLNFIPEPHYLGLFVSWPQSICRSTLAKFRLRFHQEHKQHGDFWGSAWKAPQYC